MNEEINETASPDEYEEEVDLTVESDNYEELDDADESGAYDSDKVINEEDMESSDEISSDDSEDDLQASLSDEELDAVADTAISVLQDILKYFNVGEVTIDEYEGDDGELILDITGSDLAVLIGRHGKTLDALQFIVSAVTVRKIGFRYPIVVDVEGYKNRQRQKLESIAHSAANRAANQNRSIKLRPMTPYERRIVHIALRDDSRVETASEGEGSARHVVVIPT